MERADVVVVGAGIVGLATARAVLNANPGRSVVVLEKESQVAAHQSGRNSGVIHAGVYYPPGSDKARFCTAGRISMVDYCKKHGIQHDVCGKVVVAEDEQDRLRLEELRHRCDANGVRVEAISLAQLREIEPHVTGVAALHVLDTGIVDFADVSRAIATEIEAAGGSIRFRSAVVSGVESNSVITVETTGGPIAAQRVVTCAGLHADEVAHAISGAAGADGLRVIAFRGEYKRLTPASEHLVKGLVYPVPDPQFPFLGVHLTRGIDGHVHVGPNAVLAFAREGYEWKVIDGRHLRQTFAFPGFRRFARRHWRFGMDEMTRSLSTRRFTASVRRLVPEITKDDLLPAASGVRAQAIGADGELIDDFAIRRVGRAVHVLNAPSPAATASLEIGKSIAERLELDDL